MIVQTTFAKSGNPWAKHLEVSPVVRRNPEYKKTMTINASKVMVFDREDNQVDLGKVERSRDIFDKIDFGYSIECVPEDHVKMVQMLWKWRSRKKSEFKILPHDRRGLIQIEDKNATA